MVLNPTLYALLLQEFGQVGVAHQGYKMTMNYEYDYEVHPPRLRLRPPEREYGEYYKVNCPICNDTKERLWINHRWGDQTRSRFCQVMRRKNYGRWRTPGTGPM
jgi:hypothetical protein